MAGLPARSELSVSSASEWAFEAAQAGDDAGLRRLLREIPMAGRIRLTLEREPSFFRAAAIEGARHITAIVRHPQTRELVALGCRSVRERYVNGALAQVGYLSRLRVPPQFRGRTRSVLRKGFDFLARSHRPEEAAFDISTILADNTVARRLLTAHLPGLPYFRELEPISMFLIAARRRRPCRDVSVVPGTPARLEGLIECLDRFARRHQLASHWTAQNLSPDGPALNDFLLVLEQERVTACLAFWDQRAFSQVVVQGYDRWLGFWRPWLNLFGAGLPLPGTVLPLAYLSHLAVDDDDPHRLEALLIAAGNHARLHSDCKWLALTLADRHPLAAVARRYSARQSVSLLYLVHQPQQEVALDGRIPHVEMATL